MRTLVLADLHLSRHTPPAVLRDFAAFVRENAGARIVVAGDFFDLSAEGAGVNEGPRTIADAVAHAENLRVPLAEHLDRGGELCLLAGNHDAEIGEAGENLATALRLPTAARDRLRTSPWFFRHGGLHIEHGHLYDPDNALPHPLALESTSLGVHFVREFIARTDAHAFLQANDGTPLRLFLNAFRWYGVRGPFIVYQFFRAAFLGLLQSGNRFDRDDFRERGREREAAFQEREQVSDELVATLRSMGAVPTLASTSATFARLYLDRVFSVLAMAGGGTAAALGAPVVGGGIASLGAVAMLGSWLRGHNRYVGAVSEQLRGRALTIGEQTGAKLVVMGHTHREALESSYANTGSFAFVGGAPGRPYLEIEGGDDAPRAVRRYFAGTCV